MEQVVEEKKEIKIEIIDPKVEDVLTKYYKEKGKEVVLDQALKILQEQFILYISDWKKLSQQQKSKYPDGLVNDLDEVAGILKDVRNNKIKKGGIRNGVGPNINTKNRNRHYNERKGEPKEELQLGRTMENDLDINFGSLLRSLYCWFGVDDMVCREHIHSNLQPLYHGTSFSERSKGLYQRLDEHEEVTLRKRVKSKGCK